MNPDIVKVKIKLKKDEPLTDEEESIYLTHFSAIVRARQNQHYQHSIGMLDENEWNAMVSSFKTLLSDPKNLEIWSFISPTFPKDFVNFVDEKIKEGQIYTKN